jgi:hypothetical protein
MSAIADQVTATRDAVLQIPLPIPRSGDIMPPQVPAAVAALATNTQLLAAADLKIEQMQADRIERLKRLAELDELISDFQSEIIDAWCVNYNSGLSGSVVTLEVPGWYLKDGVSKSAVLYKGTSNEQVVFYTERSINIGFNGAGPAPTGRLRPSEGMTAAAVYYNTAMEPGQFRWQPAWRYGVLTTGGEGDVCTLTINAAADRGREGYDINSPERDLEGVPIVYPPCNGSAFEEGDEVMVYFAFNWQTPVVIGFRREPKRCSARWREVGFPQPE